MHKLRYVHIYVVSCFHVQRLHFTNYTPLCFVRYETDVWDM